MHVNISDQAEAICAILREFESVEEQQVRVGEQMASLLYEQVRLAEKSRVLKQTMEQLIQGYSHV